MSPNHNILVAAEAGLAVRNAGDILDLLGACYQIDGLLLTEADLAPAFFDLKSGLAGELLQKFVNYRVRVAIVVPDPAAYGDRFKELAYEHRAHGLIRFTPSRVAAEAWLKKV